MHTTLLQALPERPSPGSGPRMVSKWEKVCLAYLRGADGTPGGVLQAQREFKEVVKVDRAAWTLVAALVLTICVPASMAGIGGFNPDNTLNQEVSYVYVVALTTCTAASLLCIWNATYTFLKLNALPPSATREFMKRLSKIKKSAGGLGELLVGVAAWANIAFVSLAVLVTSSVYLNYGAVHFWIALPIMLVASAVALYNERKMQHFFYELLPTDSSPLPQEIMGKNQVAPSNDA